MNERVASSRRASQGARDVAAALPFAALVLLMPPIILIVARPASVAGVPLVIVYIFGVWAAIILAAFLVARVLKGEDPAHLDQDDGIEHRARDLS
jgi:hypothetical protein